MQLYRVRHRPGQSVAAAKRPGGMFLFFGGGDNAPIYRRSIGKHGIKLRQPTNILRIEATIQLAILRRRSGDGYGTIRPACCGIVGACQSNTSRPITHLQLSRFTS